MHLNRLEHLITVLEGVERAGKAFDLTRWIASAAELEGEGTTTGSFTEACGTACCALGYAALDPQFRGEGLQLELRVWQESPDGQPGTWKSSELPDAATFNTTIKELNLADRHYKVNPIFDGTVSFEAGAKFFGIDENAAYYLFDPELYEDGEDRPIPPSEVIERVREVIAHDGQCPQREDDAA